MLIQSGLSEQIFEFHPLDGDMGSLMGGGVTPVGGKKSEKFFLNFDFFFDGNAIISVFETLKRIFFASTTHFSIKFP